MAAQYGVSFQPGGEDSGPNGQRRSAPVQEAVRMLSLRLPTVKGARGISPQALLQSPGGAGANTGGFSLEAALALLRKLRGANQPPQLRMPSAGQPSAGMPAGMSPAPVSTALPQPDRDLRAPTGPPRVIPGLETGEGPRQDVKLPEPFIDPRPTLDAPSKMLWEPPRTEAQHPWETDFGWFMDRDEYHRG